MSREIIIIIGLPGSGKSHLIKQRFSDNAKYIRFDDFKGGAVLDRSGFCFSRNYPEIIRQIKLGKKHIIISDIDFCVNESYLEAKRILKWWLKDLSIDYEIRSIFFQNEPEKCERNLMKDNNSDIDSRISMIETYTQLYFPNTMIAEGDEILEVHNDKQSCPR